MSALAATAEDPRDCWRTPRQLFDALNKRYRFEVDAAADASNALLPSYYTRDCDTLGWLKTTLARAYVNPPYSDIAPWTEACYRRCAWLGAFSALLLPANRTQMSWWHDYAMRGELWFFKGRIAFEPPPGVEPSSPRGNSVLVVFDPGSIDMDVRGSLHPKTGAVPA